MPIGTKVRLPGNPTVWRVVDISSRTRVSIAPDSLGFNHTAADRLAIKPGELERVSE